MHATCVIGPSFVRKLPRNGLGVVSVQPPILVEIEDADHVFALAIIGIITLAGPCWTTLPRTMPCAPG